MDHDFLKNQFQLFNNENNSNTKTKLKQLEDELGDLRKVVSRIPFFLLFFNNFCDFKQNKMVPSEKYETLCKELEISLNREKQAEIMMNQQSVQLQELSDKLAELSNTELQSYKIKEVK